MDNEELAKLSAELTELAAKRGMRAAIVILCGPEPEPGGKSQIWFHWWDREADFSVPCEAVANVAPRFGVAPPPTTPLADVRAAAAELQ